jgi:hypothetical protein
MSHAGNIKGGAGPFVGPSPGRSSDGGIPAHGDRGPGAGGAHEEKTRIGRAPTQVEIPRPSETKESKPTGIWNFTEDGLENRGEARSNRVREDRSGGRFEGQERPRSTGERPRPRTRTQEGAGDATGDAKPLEDLLPVFSESIGQESLAHHFGEELRFLGAELRPSRLPPSERAARLWAFFLAYAEANAKDPAGQSEAGRERFREVLTEHGFSGLYDVNTGRDGVAVALELLKARSPEELKQKLTDVRIEPRPETLPSEVSIPVEQHTARPELPAAERQVQQPRQEQAGFDQKEQPTPLALQTNAAPQGVVQPPVPGLKTQTGLEVTPNPEDELASRDRHGTNKRLGPHMLWSALHGFRDSQEDTALKREQWSQLAFGAIIGLVGAALLVAMLASL